MVNLEWHLPGDGRRRDYISGARQKKCNAKEYALHPIHSGWCTYKISIESKRAVQDIVK